MKLDGMTHCEKTVYLPIENIELTYRMFSSCESGRTIYCLWIVLTERGEKEECFLWDVATTFAMAKRIWHLFTDELVTPITAEDILEQLLSDPAFLYAD